MYNSGMVWRERSEAGTDPRCTLLICKRCVREISEMGFLLLKNSHMLFVDEDGWHARGHLNARIPAPRTKKCTM